MSIDLEHLLDALQVPADYARLQYIPDDSALARLSEWKCSADRILVELRLLLEQRRSELCPTDQANIISAAVSFDGQDAWVTPAARTIAGEILQHFDDPTQALLTQVLIHNIKPLFQFNPHPNLNASGRKLPRPAGGPMATQDFYEGQAWKNAPAIANLVSWCVQRTQLDWYENMWHLIIPPVMSLLDDFEARYKLRGVGIVSVMLREVPGQLLKRTGVDGLIRLSLNNCLSHLNDPETPLLIEAAVDASIMLTLLTTNTGSSEQFDQLCALLGEGVIRGVWLYASDKPEVVLATLNALPPLLRALKIGSARFLKVCFRSARMFGGIDVATMQALIAQLVHPLKPNAVKPWPHDIQIASLRLVSILIEECGPCIPRWKTAILDGVARCWVTLMDSGETCRELTTFYHWDTRHESSEICSQANLVYELRHTCESLGKSIPSMMEVRLFTWTCSVYWD
ncbi:hypothetical protein H0H87_004210 [Tephrocybe sp. NHM501043]|nr:hypothetical protein H0H87_004210 [Tephrocybe sp. NHM501043]